MSDRPKIPALDGVRGVAILLVMAYHLNAEVPTPAGRVWSALVWPGVSGVDLFFVLSGFLITGILWDSRGREGAWRRFYLRRVFRIFPLYYAFLATAFFWAHLLRSPQWPALLRAAPWLWTYGYNLLAAWRLDWAGIGPALNLTWSLCIEEQFYLLWPLAVLSLSRERLMRLCVALMILALVFRLAVFLPTGSWFPTKVLLPSRMDALAAGAWLALYLRGPHDPARLRGAGTRCLAVLAGFWLALAMLQWISPPALIMLHETVGYSVWAIGYAGLIALSLTARRDRIGTRILESRALGFIGVHAYALYLSHQPARFVGVVLLTMAGVFPARPGIGAVLLYLLATPLAFAFARAGRLLVELPFLRLRDRLMATRTMSEPGYG